jgi:hypothetical protein
MTGMEQAYHMAAVAVRRRLAEQHPDDLTVLDAVEPGDVAAFRGSYDQAEELLKTLGITATLDPNAGKMTARVAFINCSNSYDAAMAERMAAFVEAGGYLVTSDWALDGVLEKAFPGRLRWNHKGTGDEVISVEPYADSLWSEIVVLGANPQWWLWGSHPIEVVDTANVQVEAASHDLLKKYGTPIVAARFAHGKGQVFHVISHFWAKRTGTPTARHEGTAEDFLRAGMRLSDDGIASVLAESGVPANAVNFASLQSAVTATELAAQLCVRAKRHLI